MLPFNAFCGGVNMTTAKIRRDLIERGEMPPHQHGYILKDVQYNCIQPGEIEGNEFNMVIIDTVSNEAFLVNSIDFDLD